MAGSSPRLSGMTFAFSRRHPRKVRPEIEEGVLLRLFWRRRRLEEIADRSSLHEVCADEPGEGERTFDNFVSLMGKTQKHESNQRNCNLDPHGILGSSEEVLDLQGLFYPAEEQLDLPSAFVQVCDVLGACLQIVGEQTQDLARFDPD